MDLCKVIYIKYEAFINYAAVGILLTIVNWTLYSMCVQVMPMLLANICSWGITVILAYLGNKRFVFKSRDWEIRTILKEAALYLGARGATGVVEVLAQPMLYHMGMHQQLFGVDGLVAKITVSILVMVLNYSCAKLLVFPQSDTKAIS